MHCLQEVQNLPVPLSGSSSVPLPVQSPTRMRPWEQHSNTVQLPAGTQERPQYRPDGHSSWQAPGKLYRQCWPSGFLQALHTHTKHLPHHTVQDSLRYVSPGHKQEQDFRAATTVGHLLCQPQSAEIIS